MRGGGCWTWLRSAGRCRQFLGWRGGRGRARAGAGKVTGGCGDRCGLVLARRPPSPGLRRSGGAARVGVCRVRPLNEVEEGIPGKWRVRHKYAQGTPHCSPKRCQPAVRRRFLQGSCVQWIASRTGAAMSAAKDWLGTARDCPSLHQKFVQLEPVLD